MLDLINLNMHYDGESARPVLQDINLRVKTGEFVAILGPSGCGKTTLFRLIGGLLRPSGGEIWLADEEISGRTGHISYVPQQNTLFPWRNVERNAALALEIDGMPRDEALREARAWLNRVGLAGYEKSYPTTLSGGMQQRVSFLRALLSPKKLMCLDEPFGALDDLTRRNMQSWLLEIWEEHRRTILFVTHSIEEALFLADRIYILSEKPAHILEEIKVPFGRPRQSTVMADPKFVSLRLEIQELMGFH